MKTSLDCIPCFLRQALDAVRMASADPSVHEQILREVLQWTSGMDLDGLPIAVGQRIHRRLREVTGIEDPYRAAKENCNRMASRLLPELRAAVDASEDPLALAVRLSIAGNIIDMGVAQEVTESDVRRAIDQALAKPLLGAMDDFRTAIAEARSILFLADNTGEIVFDRLLIERLLPRQVTVAVRGAPVINDATMEDARSTGLHEIVEVIDNGSDAPGTILDDCSRDFVRRFAEADMVIAKGQGNFESLSAQPRPIFFLFKVKCRVIAERAGLPIGAAVLKNCGSAERSAS